MLNQLFVIEVHISFPLPSDHHTMITFRNTAYLGVDFSLVLVVLLADLLSSSGAIGLLASESGELEFLLDPEVTVKKKKN